MILEKKFKLLVIGNRDRFIHLEKFLSELNKKGIETKLIYDLDYVNKFFEPTASDGTPAWGSTYHGFEIKRIISNNDASYGLY